MQAQFRSVLGSTMKYLCFAIDKEMKIIAYIHREMGTYANTLSEQDDASTHCFRIRDPDVHKPLITGAY